MAPVLGAASNYGQSWFPETFLASQSFPVGDYRDEIFWKLIEQTGGSYSYDMGRTRYPEHLAQFGLGLSIMINNGHPVYDDGNTPHSPEAVDAFARFAADVVTQYPSVHSIEVGNEMNSKTFAIGPGWDGDLQSRAKSYAALLKATSLKVRQANPSVRILGGAAHSIPLAWFQVLFEQGAANHMDAIVIHPYTVPAEQIQRQISLLRQLPGASELPIEVTEFGHKNAAIAPAHLVKNYCQMALSGVSRIIWYPLDPRGDGLEPLMDKAGTPTPVGQSYQMITREFLGRTVINAAPDPFTYACLFDDSRLVIWGEPRTVTLAHPDLRAVDVTGAPLAPEGLRLSRAAPLIIVSDEAPITLGKTLILGAQFVVADSVDQFTFPGSVSQDPFERFVRQGGREFELETRPGQERKSVPWTPYLGSDRDGTVRVGADWVLPASWESGPIEVAFRYRATQPGPMKSRIEITPSNSSVDGVVLTVLHNDKPLEQFVVTEGTDLTILHPDLKPGDALEYVVGPGETARGDFTMIRITLLKESK
ncbi:MAG: hypothetical protein JKY94_07635 [Rhodobacteraceae bacterium]|nr:hypothetical protein [Paracoccaceae bacterium]